ALARGLSLMNTGRNTIGLRPWKPGQSGNPKGRPKSPLGNGRRALAPHEKKFVDTLVAMLDDVKQRGQALELGIPYLWGKPPEALLEAEQIDAELAASLEEVEKMSDEELEQQLLATMASEASGKQ